MLNPVLLDGQRTLEDQVTEPVKVKKEENSHCFYKLFPPVRKYEMFSIVPRCLSTALLHILYAQKVTQAR